MRFENHSVSLLLFNKNSYTLKKSVSPRTHGGFFGPAVKIVLILAVMLTWSSCAEPDEIGLGLIDERANFLSSDTISVQAYSIPDDSIPTNLGAQNMLGIIVDPVFGKTRANFITEIRLPDNNLSLGEEPVLDSVRLSVAYTGRYYGDTLTPLTVRVFELSENVPDVDTLYSTNNVSHYPDPIGFLNFLPLPSTPIILDTISERPPHIVIPLSMEFGQKILDANGTEYFENVPNFLEYFKGLYLTVDDNIRGEGGSIFNINVGSTYTSLQLYYRVGEDTVSRVQNFRISQFAKRITYVENFDYEQAHPLLKAQAFEGQTELGDSLLFLQSLGSLRANIDLPYLQELADLDDISINRAQLIIPVQPEMGDSLVFPPAERLLLFMYNEEGELENLSDFSIGSSYFGGIYDSQNNQYVFNITSYIQQLLNAEIEYYGLTLVISGAAENARRVVLKGPGRTIDPMRLEIIYTIFE